MKTEPKKDSHCSYCGARFTEQEKWPRKCFICWNESYKNPIPIVVAIIPVLSDEGYELGYLIEQRAIPPEVGGWAFPSGYVNFGETWQQAVVRELQEEVGLTTREENFALLSIEKPASGNMLLFCEHKTGVRLSQIQFVPNEEVSAIELVPSPNDKSLCFPTHNEVWKRYYNVVSR